jgi:hypothetical protein
MTPQSKDSEKGKASKEANNKDATIETWPSRS